VSCQAPKVAVFVPPRLWAIEARRGEGRGQRLILCPAQLDQQPAPGVEEPAGRSNDPPDEFEPVLAAIECDPWFGRRALRP
jgi:hypothetical protein